MPSYRMETASYTASGHNPQKLDFDKHIANLKFEFDLQYDTDAALTLLYDGYGTQLINDITIRDGGFVPIKIYGVDLVHIVPVLNQMPHGFSKVTDTASQADQTAEYKFQIPVALNKSVFSKPILEINWADTTKLGADTADYNVDSATINGTIQQTDLPPEGMKVLPDASKQGVTGESKLDIDPEGRLAFILAICRANASPFAPRNGITTVQTKIEGEYHDEDADTLRNDYSKETGNAESTGVYLKKFDQKPVIGNNSKIAFNIDATSSNLSVYFGFVSTDAPSQIQSPNIIGGAKLQATVITPADLNALRDTGTKRGDFGMSVVPRKVAQKSFVRRLIRGRGFN